MTGEHAGSLWPAVKVLPGMHASHSRLDSLVPVRVTRVPGSQVDHGSHATWFSSTEKVDCGHNAQLRSAVSESLRLTYLPILQLPLTSSHVGWFASLWKDTLRSQGVHCRFVEVVGAGVDTAVPAGQSDHRVHATTLVVLLNVDGPQGAHCRSVVGVAGTTYVPARQVVVLILVHIYEYGAWVRCNCHCEAVHTLLTIPARLARSG